MRAEALAAALLLAASLLAPAPCAAADATPVVPRLRGPVDFDGRLAEAAWRDALRLPHTLFRRWVADRPPAQDDEFVLRLFHDGRTLYVSLASYDRHVQPAARPEEADGLYAFSVITRSGALQHYRLRWAADPPQAAGEMLDMRWAAQRRGPYADPVMIGGGYVFEFSIPFAVTGWRAGDTVRVNIIVQNYEGEPGAAYNDARSSFARYALGSLDNEDRATYISLRLAP